jgi:hypothetical protein
MLEDKITKVLPELLHSKEKIDQKALLLQRHVLSVFGISEEEGINVKKLSGAWGGVRWFCKTVESRLNAAQFNNDPEYDESLLHQCTRVSETYYDAFKMLMGQRKLWKKSQLYQDPPFQDFMPDEEEVSADECELGMEAFLPKEKKEGGNFQYMHFLLLFYLRLAKSKGLIKRGNQVKYPIMRGKQCTYDYALKGTIQEFVSQAVRDETKNAEAWKHVYQNKGAREALVRNLEYIDNEKFPTRIKDRTLFGFWPGIFSTKYNEFLFWSQVNARQFQSRGIAIAKYHDTNFQNEMYELILELAGGDWYALPTPNLFRIWDAQGYDEEVKRFLCMCGGRMFQKLGTDNWQFILWCIGKSGTGKSTFIKIFEYIFDRSDVGTISQNFEEKFGLNNFFEPEPKFIVLAPDVSKGIGLPLPIMLNWISAELVQVPKKGGIARQEKLDIPCMVCSNKIALTDIASALGRRTAFLNHEVPVTQVNTQLSKWIVDHELAIIIKKFTMAYWDFFMRYADQDIWTWIPKYFKDTRDEMSTRGNALKTYFKSSRIIVLPKAQLICDDPHKKLDILDFDPRYTCPLERIQDDYIQWANSTHPSDFVEWHKDNYELVFQELKLIPFEYTGNWPFTSVTGLENESYMNSQFIYGCCLRADYFSFYKCIETAPARDQNDDGGQGGQGGQGGDDGQDGQDGPDDAHPPPPPHSPRERDERKEQKDQKENRRPTLPLTNTSQEPLQTLGFYQKKRKVPPVNDPSQMKKKKKIQKQDTTLLGKKRKSVSSKSKNTMTRQKKRKAKSKLPSFGLSDGEDADEDQVNRTFLGGF